jgi:thiamine-monophosphate kinase
MTPERALIARLRDRFTRGPARPDLPIGIGDDAAVVAPERGALDVVTTDILVEHVHFRRDWTSPAAIGHKALAVNLSDLAAMGARPRVALLSLAMPDEWPVDDFDALIDGVATLAAAERMAVVGGNLSRSPGPLVVDVTAIGSVRPRRVLTRSGARPGDRLFVTGTIGAAAAGLEMRTTGLPHDDLSTDQQECVARLDRPSPRVRAGRLVAGNRAASACMDLSDGLADAADQLASASNVGVILDAAALPLARGATAWWQSQSRDPIRAALAGGEDYELLFAVPPRRSRSFLGAIRRSGVAATCVGRLTKNPADRLLDTPSGLQPLPAGFSHFDK